MVNEDQVKGWLRNEGGWLETSQGLSIRNCRNLSDGVQMHGTNPDMVQLRL